MNTKQYISLVRLFTGFLVVILLALHFICLLVEESPVEAAVSKKAFDHPWLIEQTQQQQHLAQRERKSADNTSNRSNDYYNENSITGRTIISNNIIGEKNSNNKTNTATSSSAAANVAPVNPNVVGNDVEEKTENNVVVVRDPPSRSKNQTMSNIAELRKIRPQPSHNVTFMGDNENKSNNGKTNDNNKNPTLIIHIGPSKTGTTTVQRYCSIKENDLARDDYVYLGKFSNKNSRIALNLLQGKCFVKVEEARGLGKTASNNKNDDDNTNNKKNKIDTRCWDSAIKELEKYRAEKKNLILSDEAHSYNARWNKDTGIYNKPHYFEELARKLKDWNVVVVIGYRRYGEWLLSAIKEEDRKKCAGEVTKQRKKNGWPHEGGASCKDPWPRIVEHTNRDYTGTAWYRFADETKPVWEKHGFATKILNNHYSDDLRVVFFCDVLGDTAPQMCERLHQEESNNVVFAVHRLSSTTAAYSNIVFAAAQKGLLGKEVTSRTKKLDEAWKLQRYHEHTLGRSFRDLPLRCPPDDELERLLNRSLELEQRVVPDFFNSPRGEIAHRSAFREMAYARKEFCYLDTDVLFRNAESWNDVRNAMNNTRWS